MNQSMLITVLGLSLCCGLAQAMSANWWNKPYDSQDLSKFYDTLSKLEAAHKEKRAPHVDHFDISSVANVIRGLEDANEIKFVKDNLPLINVLSESIRKHGNLNGNLESWHSICDDECATKVLADYEANRPAELTGEVHDFSGSKCEELANILVGKDSTPIADEHVHDAMREYKAYIDDLANMGSPTKPLSFDLYNIERSVDYTNRFSGRLVSAMWPVYNFRSQYEGFAENFKHSVYEMLHANGYGVRNGEVVKVPKTFTEFIA